MTVTISNVVRNTCWVSSTGWKLNSKDLAFQYVRAKQYDGSVGHVCSHIKRGYIFKFLTEVDRFISLKCFCQIKIRERE